MNEIPLHETRLNSDEEDEGLLPYSHGRSEEQEIDFPAKMREEQLGVDIPLHTTASISDEDGSLLSKAASAHPQSIHFPSKNRPDENEEEFLNAESNAGRECRKTELSWAFSWILMMSRELNASFVFGVMVVYGFSQGVGVAINRIAVDYYWKDVQLAQPSAVQVYRGLSLIPWDVKPLWGLMTDILPMSGYHRRPYFLITGVLTVVGTMVLVTGGKLWVPLAVGMLTLLSATAALSDATIDAEVARKSRQKPILAADIQSLCGISLSVGSLVGFVFTGLGVEKFGSQGALSFMLVPAFLLVLLGFVLHEERDTRIYPASQFGKQLWNVTEQLWATLKQSQVWRPTLFMYVSLAVNPDISEGKFYWYTSKVHGPGFSEEFVGAIYATGAVGTLIAVYFYQIKLKFVSFRWILFWVQVLFVVFGMLDLVLVTGFNHKLHIPNKAFVIGDEAMTQALSRLKWMPLLVLAAKLCPPGIEGTFFSFLMSVDNVGVLTASWLGAALLQVTNVTRNNFRYLWLAVVIRNVLRLVPLFFVFLLPNTDPEEDILTPAAKHPEENIQLVVTHSQIDNGIQI